MVGVDLSLGENVNIAQRSRLLASSRNEVLPGILVVTVFEFVMTLLSDPLRIQGQGERIARNHQ